MINPKDRKAMKAITAVGIGGAFGLLLLAVLMEGGNPMSFLNIPAILIVDRRHLPERRSPRRARRGEVMIKAVKLAF